MRKIACVGITLALATSCAEGEGESGHSGFGNATYPGGSGASQGGSSQSGTSPGNTGDSDSGGPDSGATGEPTTNDPTTGAPATSDEPGTSGGPVSTSEPGSTGGPGTSEGTTMPAAECGNGVAEPGEACDGMDLKGGSCQDFGFDQGVLACSDQCTYYMDGCYECGDGVKAVAEACDGADLGGKTCQTEGFGGGTLKCAGDCKSFDTSGCIPLPSCGNGIKEGSEQCDGAQLGGQTCVGLGYDQGVLLCKPDCTFDASNCMVLNCAGQGEFCIFNENNPQSNCCPPGVKGNVLGICDLIFCI